MKKNILIYLFSLLIISGCATVPTDPVELKIYQEANDPLEPMNRATTSFNLFINKYVLYPFDQMYRFIVPQFIRTGIDNFTNNLNQPLIILNSLLQGDFKSAGISTSRLITNTTLGIGGLFDVATKMDIPYIKKDLNQTLYTWGFKNSGPYLVLPFLGPSSVRDTLSLGGEFFINPTKVGLRKVGHQYPWYYWSLNTLSVIDNSSPLLYSIEKSSLDPYIQLRDFYQQNQKEYLGIKDENETQSYDFDFDFEGEEE